MDPMFTEQLQEVLRKPRNAQLVPYRKTNQIRTQLLAHSIKNPDGIISVFDVSTASRFGLPVTPDPPGSVKRSGHHERPRYGMAERAWVGSLPRKQKRKGGYALRAPQFGKSCLLGCLYAGYRQ
jgi:hypothetical protein